jgi:hypothetical protein
MAKKDPPASTKPQRTKAEQAALQYSKDSYNAIDVWESARTGKKVYKKDSSSTPTPQQPMQTKAEQWESLRKGSPKQKAAESEYYNSINFKNKDIDRFSTRFANGKSQPWEADAAGFGKKTYTPYQIKALNKQNP